MVISLLVIYGLFACVMLLVNAVRECGIGVMTNGHPRQPSFAGELLLGLANPIAGLCVTGSPGSRVRV